MINIKFIGSKVKLESTIFRLVRHDSYICQTFTVDNHTFMQGWKTHVYCTRMFAIASCNLGVFWYIAV